MPQDPAPRVSIVMPTFNSASFLASTIESVRAQSFDGWELILCDDGSTDDTARVTGELLARDPRIRSTHCDHGGPAVARNTGLACSNRRSEFVVFLDSDDTWEPDALAVLVDALESAPGHVAAYGLARGTDMEGHPFAADDLAQSMRHRTILRSGTCMFLPADAPTSFEAMLLKNCMVTPGTTLIRRAALTRAGELDPATSPADDWDLFLRLSRQSDLLLVDHVILNWRRHPDSLANTDRRWRYACYVVRRRAIACPDNTIAHRDAAREALLSDSRNSLSDMVTSLRRREVRNAIVGAVFVLLGYGTYVRSLGGRRRR